MATRASPHFVPLPSVSRSNRKRFYNYKPWSTAATTHLVAMDGEVEPTRRIAVWLIWRAWPGSCLRPSVLACWIAGLLCLV